MNEQACGIITNGGHHTDIVVKSYRYFSKYSTVLFFIENSLYCHDAITTSSFIAIGHC